MTRPVAWLVAVALAVVGMLAGQSFWYRAAVPSAHAREHLLASSGHDYLDYAPLILRVCAAAVTLGFVAAVIGAFFGRERWAGLQVSHDRGRSLYAPRRDSGLVAPLLLIDAAAPAGVR